VLVSLFGVAPEQGRDGSAWALPLTPARLPDPYAFPDTRMMVLPVEAQRLAAAFKPDTDWQSYRIACMRAEIRISLNGVVIARVVGPRLLKGWIGFLAQDGPLAVKDFHVERLSEPLVAPFRVSDPGAVLPRLQHDQTPSYTREAMRAHIQGVVVLEGLVDTDGVLKDVKVVRSLDQTFGLDQQAIKVLQQWRFTAGLRDGVAVPMLVEIQMSFKMTR
jgi:TonB family protein